MASSYISYSRFDSFKKAVEFNSTQFNIAPKTLHNELIKYYAKNLPVYLDLGKSHDEFHPVGRLSSVFQNIIMVDLLDNQYGRFVREMLYKAIDINVSVTGLGYIKDTDRLYNFKINQIIITNYVRWF